MLCIAVVMCCAILILTMQCQMKLTHEYTEFLKEISVYFNIQQL